MVGRVWAPPRVTHGGGLHRLRALEHPCLPVPTPASVSPSLNPYCGLLPQPSSWGPCSSLAQAGSTPDLGLCSLCPGLGSPCMCCLTPPPGAPWPSWGGPAAWGKSISCLVLSAWGDSGGRRMGRPTQQAPFLCSEALCLPCSVPHQMQSSFPNSSRPGPVDSWATQTPLSYHIIAGMGASGRFLPPSHLQSGKVPAHQWPRHPVEPLGTSHP